MVAYSFRFLAKAPYSFIRIFRVLLFEPAKLSLTVVHPKRQFAVSFYSLAIVTIKWPGGRGYSGKTLIESYTKLVVASFADKSGVLYYYSVKLFGKQYKLSV
jgi:hypothetical protein